MEVFPELYTKRLTVRKMQIEDIDPLVKYANNKKISANILNIPYPYQEPDAVFRMSYVHQGFKNKVRYVFAIILKEHAEFIGEISLHLDNANNIAQLGYWIGEPFWGYKIATEACRAVLKLGFENLNLSKIFAACHAENKASEKILLHNGMVKDTITGNVVQYSLTKQEYKELNTATDTKLC
jgi:[ribosomal protein S5]-alanine N-acetyltransferase